MIHNPDHKSAARIQLEIQLMRLAYQDRAARGQRLNTRRCRARRRSCAAAVLLLLLALCWHLA